MTDDIVERLLDPERGGGSDAYEAAKKIERLLEQVTQWQDLAVDLENRLEAALDDNGRLQAQLGQARGLLEDRAATIDRLLGARVIPGTNIPDAGTPSY